jgi:hypothetical protein
LSEQSRAHLLAMAELWERLAQQHNESTEVPKQSTPESEQGTLHQQHQVQPADGKKE